MTSIYGNNTKSTFEDGLKTDVIDDLDFSNDNVRIEIGKPPNTETINIVAPEVLINGSPIGGGGGGAGPVLTENLSIGPFDITNIPQYDGNTTIRGIAEDIQNIVSSVPSTETVFNNVLKCTGKMISQGLSVNNSVGQNDMSGTLLHDGNIELYGNINLNNNNITGFGFGGAQTLQALNNTVSLHGSDINSLKAKTFNISNVVNDSSTEFIGDILSSSLSNGSLGSLTKQFENLFLSGVGVMGALTTTTGNVIHRLTGTKSFSISDDGTPLAFTYFSVGITGITSQLKHIFANGLEPSTTGFGSLGSALKRFNTLFVDNVNTTNLTSPTGTIILGSSIDFGNVHELLNCPSINGIRPSGGLYSESSETVISGVQTNLLLLGNDATASGSLMVDANSFLVGDTYSFKLGGSITCLNNDVFTLNILTNPGLPSESIFASIIVTVDGAQTNGWFEVEIEFIVRQIGASGVAKMSTNGHYSYFNSTQVSKGYGINNLNNTTFNTTVDNILQLTYTTVETTVSIVLSQASLTKLY